MELGLKDRTAIVTGSTRGIGKAVAASLLKEGATVCINSRHGEDVESVVRDFKNIYGGRVIGVPADLTKNEEVARMVETAAERCGSIDILVNNAGIFEALPFDSIHPEDFLLFYDVNVVGAVRATQAVLPYMLERRWGRIVMMASENGPQPDPNMIHYNLTKSALINLASSLAKAYGSSGILVNAVSPAFIGTPGVEEMMKKGASERGMSFDAYIKKFQVENRPNIMLGRMGTVEEVASLVSFLCSERASYVNGSNFRVDGGSVGSVN